MRLIDNTKCLLVSLSILSLAGCQEDVVPQSGTATADQVHHAPGAFTTAVDAIPSSMTGSFYFGPNRPYDFGITSFFLQRDVMGQDIACENHGSEHYTTWYGCGVGLGPAYLAGQVPWTYYYKWIKNCNEVIGWTAEPTDAQKPGIGIAHCMRAYYYLDLARMFAQQTYAKDRSEVTVPIVIESLADPQHNARATNENMFAFILSDLDKAEEMLKGWTAPDRYTPDIHVVYGLKARAYLTMEDWANAEKYAKLAQEGFSVLTEEQLTDRMDGFNQINQAWILATHFKATDPNITENDGDSCWGSQMIIEVQPSGCGYAANYGTPKRIDAHLYSTIPETDVRRGWFADFAIDDHIHITRDNAGNVVSIDITDEARALAGRISDNPEGILNTGLNTASLAVGGLEVKFRPKNGEKANQFQAFCVDVPLMRVEEMILIEAEAAGMQDEGRGIGILTAFAKQRDPDFVYGTHADENYGSTYAKPFQNEVWWQRRVELWGEGFATFDIKRLDKGVIRSYAGTNHGKDYRWNIGGYETNKATYPSWMDLCIVRTETQYNVDCTNNPTPNKPLRDSEEYSW